MAVSSLSGLRAMVVTNRHCEKSNRESTSTLYAYGSIGTHSGIVLFVSFFSTGNGSIEWADYRS